MVLAVYTHVYRVRSILNLSPVTIVTCTLGGDSQGYPGSSLGQIRTAHQRHSPGGRYPPLWSTTAEEQEAQGP